MSEPTYGSCDAVRAMLQDELSDEQITEAAKKLGWPGTDPHPYLVAEKLDRR